jgi:hypothetical protein
MKWNLFVFFILFLCLITIIKTAGVVCSEDELAKELQEDLADNGKLDCLRESLPPSGNEDRNQKELREKAMWTGDCSFEAESNIGHWKQILEKNYDLKKGLVNVEGEPVENDFDDQADMCEIIRALIANGNFEKIGDDVTSINQDMITSISCAGIDGQTKPCAANPKSFSDKKSWVIFLDGKSISLNNKPKFDVVKVPTVEAGK